MWKASRATAVSSGYRPMNKTEFSKNLEALASRDIQRDFSVYEDMPVSILNPQRWIHINKIFSKSTFDSNPSSKSYDAAILWGNGLHASNFTSMRYAMAHDETALLLCEDGFIRSYGTWADSAIPQNLLQPCSLTVDTLGYYFDATRPTRIENMLNDDSLNIGDTELNESKRIVEKIVNNKISKYNHQPLAMPDFDFGKHSKKVLVIDQSYGDYAISKGLADDSTFKRMLADAIDENPDSDILVKTHPDSMCRGSCQRGYYQGMSRNGRVIPVTFPVNPYSLINISDTVYVCSSQFGFEALMAGKTVKTYGVPFYSNWGVTEDKIVVDRRKRKRNLYELFYIFYILYTFWYNPKTNSISNVDDVVDYMIELRDSVAR